MDRAVARAEALRLRAEGMPLVEIARAVGVTDRSVSRWVKAAGLAAVPPPRLSDAELAQAEMLLADGCSLNEAARSLGRSKDTMRRRFPGRGWTVREGGVFAAAIKKAGGESIGT